MIKKYFFIYWILLGTIFVGFLAKQYMKNPDTSLIDMILYIITGIGLFGYLVAVFLPLFIIFHKVLLRKNLGIIKNVSITLEEFTGSYITVLIYLLIMFYLVVDPLNFYQLDYLGEVLPWTIITIIILIIKHNELIKFIQNQM